MSDAKLRRRQQGGERLSLALLLVERLCVDHVPASARLEAAIGRVDTRRQVVALARSHDTRDRPTTTRGWSRLAERVLGGSTVIRCVCAGRG
jgi:hypothetical protein